MLDDLNLFIYIFSFCILVLVWSVVTLAPDQFLLCKESSSILFKLLDLSAEAMDVDSLRNVLK